MTTVGNVLITGAKGKGGGGGYRAPREEADSLQAIQYVTLIDVVSEGPIEGLVEGDKSIYLNETPLRTPKGTLTMNGVSWHINTGTPDQTELPYASGAESETSVGVEITKLSPKGKGPDSGKYQFSVTNENATRLRITLGVQGLYQTLTDQKHAGDIIATSVAYKITIKDAANKVITDYSRTLKGKTTSQYLWSLMFNLTGTAPWLVTVERTTDDSTTATLCNALYLSSYTEIVGYSFTYPNTAAIAVKASAESFSGTVPNRVYYIKGLRVQVPSNYNPETRAYDGIWDGTFKLAWTDNPAWVLYDMITNDRYGVAKYLPHSYLNANELCDKWYLYRIAQICDELVPDGFGGMEPRYTFNYQIQGAGEAKEVIQSIASVFHGMTYWSSGLIYARADFTDDPVRTITQANVKDGTFTYSSASQQERHSVALVKWNDPDDLGRSHVEAVYDWEAYRRLGYRPIETVAYGCYSRGQAHRHGKWLLASEETPWTVTVEMGLDGFDLVPGDIVKLADPSWMGYRAGGRVKSISGTKVTLDAPFETMKGETYQISVCDTDGGEETQEITAVNSDAVTVKSAFTHTFAPNAVWSISGSLAEPRQFRVQSIRETDKASIQLTLIEINPHKFEWVEQNLRIEMPPERRPLKEECLPPDILNVTERTATVGLQLVQKALFSWGYSTSNFYVSQYRVCYTDNLGNKHYAPWQNEATFELTNVQTGEWNFAVQAKTFDGRESAWASIDYEMAGTSALSPLNPPSLRLYEWGYMQKDGVHISNVDARWNPPQGMNPIAIAGYEVYYRYDTKAQWQKYASTDADETEHTLENVLTGRTIYVQVKTRSRLGVLSSGVTSSLKIVGKDAPPAAPTGLKITMDEGNRLVLHVSWDKVDEPDIAGYRVYLDGKAVCFTEELFATITATTAGKHTVAVKAADNSKQESKPAQEDVLIPVPSAPASITAVALRTDRCSIRISWSVVEETDIAGYQVQFDGIQIAKLTPDTTASTTIADSRVHTFRARSVTTGGLTSPWAEGEQYFSVLPPDVTDFTVKQSPLKKSSLIFSWSPVDGGDIDYYEIRQGRDYAKGTLTARAQGTSVTVENWTGEGEFSFGIKAHCIGGYESQYPAYFTAVFSMRPNPPSNFKAVQNAIDPSIVNLTWDASPDLDVVNYEIRDGLTWEDSVLIGFTSGTMLSVPCTQSHEFNFLIRANNSAGFSSDTVSTFCEATLEPPDVTGFTGIQDGDAIDLWWDAIVGHGVDWYEIREGNNWDSGTVIVTGETSTEFTVPVAFERGWLFMVKAHSRTGYYSNQPARLRIATSHLSPKNVLVERVFTATGKWSDYPGRRWVDFDDDVTWANVKDESTFSHDHTRWGDNPATWATIGGRFTDYPAKRWADFGGTFVLTLTEGATHGEWVGREILLKRLVKANIAADFQWIGGTGETARLQYAVSRETEKGEGYGPWLDYRGMFTTTLAKIKFRIIMETTDARHQPYVTYLRVVVDMPDVVKSGRIEVGTDGAKITYGFEYAITPTVVATADTAEARAVIVGAPGLTDCSVKVLNTDGAAIAGVVNWSSYGY